jgi:hypothetical protein
VINGGRTNSKEFCSTFGVVAAVYGPGLAFNLWNPIGRGGTAALAVVGV